LKPLIALALFAIFIAGLFLMTRDRKSRTSWVLLIPLLWLLIAGSRNVGEWLSMGMPSEGDAYTEGNALDRNVLTAVIAIGVVVLSKRREKVVRILADNRPLILYLSYCLLSLAWSDYAFVGLKRWVRAVGDLIMILIVLTEHDWLAARRKVYAWAGFLLMPTSILLIKYFPDLGRSYGLSDGRAFWTGVATGKNELGMVCMVIGITSAARILDVWRRREKGPRRKLLIVHGSILVMAAWLIHMADSATSLACLAMGCTVLVLTSWRPVGNRIAFVHLLVWCLVGVAFCSLFLGIGTGFVKGLGRNETLTGRTDLWVHILTLIDNPMLGTGYESFWVGPRLEKMRNFAMGVNQCHNGYLEVYVNLGWVGVALLGFVVVTGYRNMIRAFRKSPDNARLGLAFFVVTLAYNFTEGAFKFRNPVWISFLMAIVVAPMLTRSRTAEPELTKLPKVKKSINSEECIYEEYA
jgi:exopolysaccharide production protein ExoQ